MAVELSEKQKQESWMVVKFAEIAKNVSERINPAETDLEVYVGLEHLDPQSLSIQRKGVPSDVKGQKLRVRPGQIIFGKRRAYQKKLAIADFDGICSAHAMVLEELPGMIIPGLLPFFMQSDMFMDRAVSISEGSLSPTIKWKTLAIQEFPLPSLEQQIKVLEVLEKVDEITKKIEASIESISQLIESCSFIFFTKGVNLKTDYKKTAIGILPAHWLTKPFKDFLINGTQNGLYKGKDAYGKGLKMVHMSEMFHSMLLTEHQEMQLVSLSKKEVDKYCLKNADLLFARRSLVKEGAGLCCIYEGAAGRVSFESSIIRTSIDNKKANPYFFNFFFRSKVGRWHLERIIQTVAASGITGTDLKKIIMPIPPMDEQNEIVEQLNILYGTYNTLIAKRNSNIRLTRKMSSQMLS